MAISKAQVRMTNATLLAGMCYFETALICFTSCSFERMGKAASPTPPNWNRINM